MLTRALALRPSAREARRQTCKFQPYNCSYTPLIRLVFALTRSAHRHLPWGNQGRHIGLALLVIKWNTNADVPDVRVRFMWETNGAVLQNSQQCRQIFEDRSANFVRRQQECPAASARRRSLPHGGEAKFAFIDQRDVGYCVEKTRTARAER